MSLLSIGLHYRFKRTLQHQSYATSQTVKELIAVTCIINQFFIKKTIMTNNYQKPSLQTQEEALKISKGTQRPTQTKEQTKLIAQGIQKGIDLYKKQQKEKSRDLNKKLKKTARQKELSSESDDNEMQQMIVYRQHWLPWLLLIVTWVGVGIYFFMYTSSNNI
jgi:cobalamin biosynthesis Mg chelatase CobN